MGARIVFIIVMTVVQIVGTAQVSTDSLSQSNKTVTVIPASGDSLGVSDKVVEKPAKNVVAPKKSSLPFPLKRIAEAPSNDTTNVESNAGNSLQEQGAETIAKVKNSISFGKVFWSLVFFLIGYLFIRFTVRILNIFAERSSRVRLSFKRFIPIYRVLAWVLVIFIIIRGIISPSRDAIVALGASIGVAVGFAAQDLLKNIFGGITVLLEKPFQVGDKIEVGSSYGEVTHIGFRSSRIVTADDSAVTIPNAELTSKMVSNANAGENNCQVVAEIYLPPDINTSAVREIALEAAQVSSLVYLKKPIAVLFFHELKEDRTFLKMRLKAYVLDIRYEFAFKSEMTEIVLHELYKRKILTKEDHRYLDS